MSEENVANALATEGGQQEEEQETAQATGENAGEGEQQSGENEQTEEHRRKRLGGWQRKIQRLEQENEALRSIVVRGHSEGSKTETAAKPDESGKPTKPKLDDFDSYDKFEAAKDEYFEKLADWKLEQRDKARTAEAEKTKQQEQQATAAQKWQAQQKTGRETHSDFDEVVSNPDLKINEAMGHVIMESEVGADLAYYLGTHESECARIAQLNPILAAKELGKIEARLATKEQAAEDKEKPTVSKALPPIKPTRKSSPADNGELRDDLPADEWAKRFRKRLEAR